MTSRRGPTASAGLSAPTETMRGEVFTGARPRAATSDFFSGQGSASIATRPASPPRRSSPSWSGSRCASPSRRDGPAASRRVGTGERPVAVAGEVLGIGSNPGRGVDLRSGGRAEGDDGGGRRPAGRRPADRAMDGRAGTTPALAGRAGTPAASSGGDGAGRDAPAVGELVAGWRLLAWAGAVCVNRPGQGLFNASRDQPRTESARRSGSRDRFLPACWFSRSVLLFLKSLLLSTATICGRHDRPLRGD
jgi:hypothetical protein